MIPGFSATPMLLAVGGGSAKPFSLSGSWETGAEGWELSSVSVSGGGLGGNPRTGQACLSAGFTKGTAEYHIPAEATKGLRIYAEVYVQRGSMPGPSSLSYRIGGGNYISLDSINNSSWRLLSGDFVNPNELDVTIRIDIFALARADDWAITGVKA